MMKFKLPSKVNELHIPSQLTILFSLMTSMEAKFQTRQLFPSTFRTRRILKKNYFHHSLHDESFSPQKFHQSFLFLWKKSCEINLISLHFGWNFSCWIVEFTTQQPVVYVLPNRNFLFSSRKDMKRMIKISSREDFKRKVEKNRDFHNFHLISLN